MSNPNFGDIIETNFIYSDDQRAVRKYGDSVVQVSGQPATYHAGDVVHMPYQAGETSTIEAIGLAWSAFANGIDPAE
tara:strand:- start:277 stop:507 length:231 start_codon:yes stop_codon:yes gene_type:complete